MLDYTNMCYGLVFLTTSGKASSCQDLFSFHLRLGLYVSGTVFSMVRNSSLCRITYLLDFCRYYSNWKSPTLKLLNLPVVEVHVAAVVECKPAVELHVTAAVDCNPTV
jgi:hypothetical protein